MQTPLRYTVTRRRSERPCRRAGSRGRIYSSLPSSRDLVGSTSKPPLQTALRMCVPPYSLPLSDHRDDGGVLWLTRPLCDSSALNMLTCTSFTTHVSQSQTFRRLGLRWNTSRTRVLPSELAASLIVDGQITKIKPLQRDIGASVSVTLVLPTSPSS